MKSRIALALLASTFLPQVSLADDPVVVLRPPGLERAAGVLPNDAFAAAAPTTPSGDPDALIFQSWNWDYSWVIEKDKNTSQYLHFETLPTIHATVSLSAGGIYDFIYPSAYKPPNGLPSGQTCGSNAPKGGANVRDFFVDMFGNLVNGVYQTGVIDNEWHMSRITAKKIGTMNITMSCLSTTAVMYPDGSTKMILGSATNLVLRVEP